MQVLRKLEKNGFAIVEHCVGVRKVEKVVQIIRKIDIKGVGNEVSRWRDGWRLDRKCRNIGVVDGHIFPGKDGCRLGGKLAGS